MLGGLQLNVKLSLQLFQHCSALLFTPRLICGLILLIFIVCVLTWARRLCMSSPSEGACGKPRESEAYLEDLREARELEEATYQ